MLSERLEQGRVLAQFSKHLRADKAHAALGYSSEGKDTIYPLGAIKVPS